MGGLQKIICVLDVRLFALEFSMLIDRNVSAVAMMPFPVDGDTLVF